VKIEKHNLAQRVKITLAVLMYLLLTVFYMPYLGPGTVMNDKVYVHYESAPIFWANNFWWVNNWWNDSGFQYEHITHQTSADDLITKLIVLNTCTALLVFVPGYRLKKKDEVS
jgi:hypothetical protein